MFVKDYMTRDVVSVFANESTQEAWQSIIKEHIRQVPVMKDEKLVGIVSRTDLLRGMQTVSGEASLGDLMNPSVTDVMTPDPLTVHPEDGIEDAAKKMFEERIGSLPVTLENGTLVGMLTRTDLFRALVQIIGIGEESVRIQMESNDYKELLDEADDLSDEMVPLSTLIFHAGKGGPEWKSLFRFRSE